MNGLPHEWHGGWLPPGTPAPCRDSTEVQCENPDCPSYHVPVELWGTSELGTFCLDDEEAQTCPDCDEQMQPISKGNEMPTGAYHGKNTTTPRAANYLKMLCREAGITPEEAAERFGNAHSKSQVRRALADADITSTIIDAVKEITL